MYIRTNCDHFQMQEMLGGGGGGGSEEKKEDRYCIIYNISNMNTSNRKTDCFFSINQN